MTHNADCTRRDFVKLAAGALLAGGAGAARRGQAAEQSSPAPTARPRISSVSWNFHNLGAGNTRPDQAIEISAGWASRASS